MSETRSPPELFDAMKRSADRRTLDADLASYDPATNSTVGDQMPDYCEFMSDDRIWEIVKFLKELPDRDMDSVQSGQGRRRC